MHLRIALALAALAPGWTCGSRADDPSPASPTVVQVAPGQTLNAAIADVEGPVCILLPPGVTEHEAGITRNETVIIKGAGRDLTILRPSAGLGPDEGVALIRQSEGYDGDFVLADLTYDRAFHPGITASNPQLATGATILRVSAGNRVEFRNVLIMHFDFGAREGQDNSVRAFRFAHDIAWSRSGRKDTFHTKDVVFRNVHIDFAKGGGIRHRPGGAHLAFDFGTVDRLWIDEACRFRGSLCDQADPAHTVGEVWKGRGYAGPMYGIGLLVFERALIDGVWHGCDYGAWRSGGVGAPEAVAEWRMDLLDAGFGDQFWQRPIVAGLAEGERAGHMIFKDVRLEGHREGVLHNDRGLRTIGSWKTVTVDGCTVINRVLPISLVEAAHQGLITVRDTTLVPVGGEGPGIWMDAISYVGVHIDGLHVYGDPASDKPYYTTAIDIAESGPGGGLFTIGDIRADGYLYHLLNDNVGSNSTVHTVNLQGRQVVPDTLVKDARPVAVLPRKARSFKIDGDPEPLDWDPIATIEDFSGTKPFSRLDLYTAFDPGPGVFVRVVVGGVQDIRNTNDYPLRLYRGDAIQFFITRGRPGEVVGGTMWTIARHDEKGLAAFRYNFWPEVDLPQVVVDIPLAIKYHEDTREIVYEFMLSWEEIGLPAPWYEDLCVDLIVADGRAYCAGAYYGAQWNNPYGDVDSAIFHPRDPRSLGAKWIRFE